MAQHRTTTPSARLAAALLGLVVLVGIGVGGVASAHTDHAASQGKAAPQPGVTRAQTQPVPGLNRGESAQFVVVNDGRSLTIFGQAQGMRPGVYVSLAYSDARCSQPLNPSGDTVDGAWESHGGGNQQLYARYDGADYRAVTGRVQSVSIRAITAASNAGGGNYTLTAQARACAPLNPGR